MLNTKDPAFLNWLAGFTDGEGCFQIAKKTDKIKRRYGYVCTFHLNLRADDYRILVEIRNRLGIGRIYTSNTKQIRNPILHYKVFKKEECLQLVDIFDEYPLRAKKAADFAIWRLAVISCNDKNIHGGKNQSSPKLWEDVANLAEALTTLRIYQDYEDLEARILNPEFHVPYVPQETSIIQKIIDNYKEPEEINMDDL